jgi:TP901 family phage tail tape measure protein
MADRVVKVSLIAEVSGYIAGMEKAAAATNVTQAEVDKLAKQRQTFDMIGKAAVAAGGLIAVGVGVAVAKYAEFDQAMSGVAATGEDARKNINKLTDAAIDAGARTVFSAKESANAIEELAKAGLSAGDILNGGLNGALDLAAAGGLGVAQAAGIAATTLGQFRLKGSQAAHVADLLAAGAGKAMGDVTDISQALSQAGTVANQFGISVDDTVGTLAAFANAGMLGSDAGTSFRTMLLRLANPTGEAADEMKQLGIEAYNSSGQFVGMEALAGQLQKRLGGLTQEQRNAALATIFGQDAIRGANVLYVEGAKGIKEWNDKVNDSGYAAETAATRLDNLKGDIEQLGGAIDSAFIGMGKAADGPLRFVVQQLTGVVDVFNGMPEPAKQATLVVGAVTSAILLAGGTALLAVPKFVAFRASVAALKTDFPATARVVGGLTTALKGLSVAAIAVGAAAVGIPALESAIRDMLGLSHAAEQAIAKQKSLKDALNDQASGYTWTSGEISKSLKGLVSVQDNWWHSFSGDENLRHLTAFTDGLHEFSKQLAGMPIDASTAQFSAWAKETGASREQAAAMLKEMPEFRESLQNAAKSSGQLATDHDLLNIALGKSTTATDDNTKSTKSAAQAYLDAQDNADKLNDQINDLIAATMKANGVGQDAVSQNIDYKDAVAKVDEQIDKIKKHTDGYSSTLNTNKKEGRENMSMLVDLASKSQSAAKAQFDLDGNTNNYRKTLIAGNKKIYDSAIAMGASKEAARKLADQVYKIPTKREIDVIAQTRAAANALDALKRRYDNATIHIRVQANGISTISSTVGRMVGTSRAGGGFIPGTPSHSDNMLLFGASGEFVTRTAQAQKPGNRRVLEWMNAGGDFGCGFAYGGFVQPRYASNTTAPVVNVAAPSLEGAVITGRMRLDPDGFVTLIDGRISAAMPSAVSVTSQFGSH